MDPAFVSRSLKASAWLSALTFLFVAYYAGFSWATGIALGAAWSIANIALIRALIVRAIRPQGAQPGPVAVIALIKFPLLYAAGYLIMSRDGYDPLAPVIGFSIPLLVFVLKAGGRMLTRVDGHGPGRGFFSATAGR